MCSCILSMLGSKSMLSIYVAILVPLASRLREVSLGTNLKNKSSAEFVTYGNKPVILKLTSLDEVSAMSNLLNSRGWYL